MALRTSRQLLTKRGFLLFVLSLKLSSEVSVDSSKCALWNAALCKPAYQVGVYKNGTPDKAVDGNRNTFFYNGSCFHTNKRNDNWWMVDLMDEYLVHQIHITNRDISTWGNRLTDVFIHLFLSDPRNDPLFPYNTDGYLCTHVVNAYQGTKSFECPSPIYARYVKLTQNTGQYFAICEVGVMVSRRREHPGCKMLGRRPFTILRNSALENGFVTEDMFVDRDLACVEMCDSRGDLCSGCLWTKDTRRCQMLKVDPYYVGRVVVKVGTVLYLEYVIKCTGSD